MSYILDALKKSERRRPPGPVPDLFTIQGPQDPGRRRRPSVAAFAVALVAVCAAVFGLWTWSGRTGSRQSAAPATAVPTASPPPRERALEPPSVVAGQVAPPPRAVVPAAGERDRESRPARPAERRVVAQIVQPAVQPAGLPAPRAAPALLPEAGVSPAVGAMPPPPGAVPPAPVASPPSPPGVPPAEPSAVPAAPQTPPAAPGLPSVPAPGPAPPPPGVAPADAAPAPVLPAAAAAPERAAASEPAAAPEEPPPDGRVVDFADLPPGVRALLPALDVSGHVWSDDPTLRLLSVQDRIVREGSEAAPGVRLEQVTQTGAVFVFRGWRFRVAGF